MRGHTFVFFPPKDYFAKKVWTLKKFGDSRGTVIGPLVPWRYVSREFVQE